MRFLRAVSVLLVPVVFGSMLVVGTGATTAPAEARKHYTPKRGPMFNNPLSASNEAQWRIFDHIVNTIRSTPRNSRIRIMSWNIYSHAAVNALIAANRRGVVVRVLMDNKNRTELPNPGFDRLRWHLRHDSAKRKRSKQSRAKTCKGSCRGRGGAAHSKYFLFSRAGKAKQIVIAGGANLTAAAAINQWNEVYTWTGRKRLYKYHVGVFEDMWKDKVGNPQFLHKKFGNTTIEFTPFRGRRAKRDPVSYRLKKVHCHGTRGKYGENGRTVVRAAPDVIRGKRGMKIARLLKGLYNDGCDVKLVYTVMGRDVHRFLSADTGRGPLPKRHLVQDYNGDGEFDNYFHIKAMTVNGHYGNDHRMRFVLQGSSNWSDYAAASDENIAVIVSSGRTLQYQKWITRWFDNPPLIRPLGYTAAARRANVDPYAHVDMD
jgi:hypothetical protein